VVSAVVDRSRVSDVRMNGRPIPIAWPVAVSMPIPVAWTAVKSVPIRAVIPGAGADEPAAYEPARPIVAVRRASVRIIAVVSIRANRRWAYGCSNRTNSNAHGNLGVSAFCHDKKQNS
jgi:hypothetical protein